MEDYITRLAIKRVQDERTLQDVADELDIHKTTLHYWEMKTSKPRFDVFLKWCKILNVGIWIEEKETT